jgi:hypothetical protein
VRLLRRLQLTLQPFQGDGFEGIVSALAIKALKSARTFAARPKGRHHPRAAKRARSDLVELSHPQMLNRAWPESMPF